jgi:hypothetical protein
VKRLGEWVEARPLVAWALMCLVWSIKSALRLIRASDYRWMHWLEVIGTGMLMGTITTYLLFRFFVKRPSKEQLSGPPNAGR